MQTLREQVTEFHRAFGQPIMERPAVPSDERVRLRLRLIAEEFCELLEATLEPTNPLMDTGSDVLIQLHGLIERARVRVNLVEVADALADLDYVVEGSRLEFGIDGGPVAAEVHRSNLSKVWPDGTVHKREDGKIEKPPTWAPPDIAGVLRAQGGNV